MPSPQSNNQTSPLSRRESAEWFLVREGCADAVPRKVILMFDIVTMRICRYLRMNVMDEAVSETVH